MPVAGLSLSIIVLLGLLLISGALLWRQHRRLKALEQQQKKSRQEQQRLRALIDNVPDLIYVKDSHGRYLDCNRAFAAFIGRERNEVIGADSMLASYGDVLAKDDAAVLSVKAARRLESWTQYYDGRRVLLETLKLPIHGSADEVDTVLSISRDITRRKHEELLLRLQTSIQDQVVRGRELSKILHDVVVQVESAFPDLHCSVLLLDQDRQHLQIGAAPTIPSELTQAIDGLAVGTSNIR